MALAFAQFGGVHGQDFLKARGVLGKARLITDGVDHPANDLADGKRRRFSGELIVNPASVLPTLSIHPYNSVSCWVFRPIGAPRLLCELGQSGSEAAPRETLKKRNSMELIEQHEAPINEAALENLIGKMVGDLGAVVSGALVVLGDRLGLYRALAEVGPADSAKLAGRTQLDERYVREWLANQAASGYVNYEPNSGRFSMSAEQKAVFADPASPVAMTGGFYAAASVYHDEPRVAEAFRTGSGIAWQDRHQCLFCGTEKFFRPGYAANLVQHWIPALDGVAAKLEAGAQVADIGCGHGASTIIMAQAFPKSKFTGFDLHPRSIECARQCAREGGLANVAFETASAKEFPGRYDFITTFDALHDMGDPLGAAAHVRERLHPDGTWLIVEPLAGDSLQENLNPVGRVFYGFSTMVCTPNSRSQEIGLALGAQAGERRLREVMVEAGFRQFRRAAQTPFNLILEARP